MVQSIPLPTTQSQGLQPNLFIFSGDGAKITYSTQDKSQFDFEDSDGKKYSFSGNDIQIENSTLGQLVTVILERTLDAGSTSLTLLMPPIQLTELVSRLQPIKTVAIKAEHRGPNAGHNAITEIYQFHAHVGVGVYNLKIGTQQLDTPLFIVKLTALAPSSENTSDTSIALKTVKGLAQGSGEITFIVKPGVTPIIINTNLEGTYTTTTQKFIIHDVHPVTTEFKLIGVPPIQIPEPPEQLPIIRPNVILSVTINGTGFGTKATATYEYRTNADQPWQTVKDVPVEFL